MVSYYLALLLIRFSYFVSFGIPFRLGCFSSLSSLNSFVLFPFLFFCHLLLRQNYFVTFGASHIRNTSLVFGHILGSHHNFFRHAYRIVKRRLSIQKGPIIANVPKKDQD